MSDGTDPRDKFKKPLQRPALDLPSRRIESAASPSSSLPVPVKAPASEAPAPSSGLARLFEAIGRALSPKPPAKEPAEPVASGEPAVFTVAVAALTGDADGARGAALLHSLEGKGSLGLKALSRSFALDTLQDPAMIAAALSNTRMVTANEKADLLIWGEVGKDDYRLRFTTAAQGDEDRAGYFGPTTRCELPFDLNEAVSTLLYAATLAAAEAATPAQKGAVRRLLPVAAGGAEALAARPPVQMSMPQQRSVQTVFGHVAAATALAVPPSQADAWFEKALGAYRAAQKRVARTDPAWETGLLHKYIGAVLGARAERSKTPAPLLEDAVKAWRAAAETLTREAMPQEWAGAQTRLGKALYRLDLITGNTELLREALQALQAALQVYSRTETPLKWADIMHDIAQVLEVYGDQLRNPEVLRRAIETCESVLMVLTRDRMPLTWAATQNTLGSALFLLDKHTDGIAHLEGAIAALEAAHGIFAAAGAKGPAQVAARNLGHVRKLAEERRGRQIVDPDWVDGPGPRPRRRR